ncbi:MAG: alpha/beta hydrolase [Myxococcales bacterium]|nr:alpha/beta hydrolase [Myxococcales bacterium]
MRVVEAGDVRSEPLLLIHDFLSSHLAFDEVINQLAETFYVIAPDLPGSGDSEKPAPARFPYSVEAFAEAMADLIAAYGGGRAGIVGHGLGGGIAIAVASRYPELVTRLVLVSPLCYPTVPSLRLRLALSPLVGWFYFKQLFGRGSFKSYFRDEVFAPAPDVPYARIDRLYEAFNTPSGRESAFAVLQTTLDTRPIVAQIQRLRPPILVAWGRDDAVYPAKHALRLAREVPNARLELFDAGHCPHDAQPAAFVRCVRHFFESPR